MLAGLFLHVLPDQRHALPAAKRMEEMRDGEINRAIASHADAAAPSHEHLEQLPYLRAVVKEVRSQHHVYYAPLVIQCAMIVLILQHMPNLQQNGTAAADR